MVDIADIDRDDKILDPACGSGGFLIKALEKFKESMPASRQNERINEIIEGQLFGLDAERLAIRACKLNMIVHNDGKNNMFIADSLLSLDKINRKIQSQDTKQRNDIIKEYKFQVILTNPPFGAKEKKKIVLNNFTLSQGKKSCKSEILFIERCLDLLDKKGKLLMIIPDGILNNERDSEVRRYIRKYTKIVAIISLPLETFKPSETGVRANILYAIKREEPLDDDEIEKEDGKIFFAIAETVGYDATGRKIDKNDLMNVIKPKFLEIKKDVLP